MSDIQQRLAGLSTKEKRELLAQTLREIPAPSPPAAHSLPDIVPSPHNRHKPFPLTPIQQAYWIGRGGGFELGNVGAHVYFEVDAPRLDLQKCRVALQHVIDRHDMLRAVFRPDGQQQVLESAPPYNLQITDVRGCDSREAAERLDAIRQRMSRQVFSPDQWPLFEVHVSCPDESHTRLHFSFDLLVCDLRSAQIFLDEWLQLYLNADASLPPLELSFRDYVLAELAWQESEPCRRSSEYWRDRIPQLPPAPELPLAKPASSVLRPEFVRRRTRLEPELWSRLKKRAKQCDLTPAALLLTVFAEILTAWSRNSRFTLNVIVFNRLPVDPQVNEIIGEFTSMILLAIDNSVASSFQDRALRIQQQFWNDLDHRHFHGLSVLRELSRMQGCVGLAIMPVVFTCDLVHDFVASEREQSAFLTGEVVYGISQTPQVSLDHQAFEQAGALIINWDAVEELFPEGMLSEMSDAEARLLYRLADEPEAWMDTSPWLYQQCAIDNINEAPFAPGLLHSGFARNIQSRPDALAIITPDRNFTYHELSLRSQQVARRLRELGARPNALVAVVMEKGWEQVVAVLGILQSGAAYLPIDPEVPKDRLHFLLENGGVTILLTQNWLRERLVWPTGVELLSVDTLEPAGVDDPFEPVQSLDDLAYVIYTSGSTGFPKGVMISHRGAVNTILDINRRFDVGPEDRVLALSSLNFDLSVYDIFGLLTAGGAIVIPEPEASRDPVRWVDLMDREKVTIWNSVPALMEMLTQQVSADSGRLPGSLRLALLSGDWIPLNLPEQIRALGSGAELISLGGATEASIWSILYPIAEVDREWKSIPYGKPMANQWFRVLNEKLEPCPVWALGRLYIGGIGLAKGYWRDEEKTRTSFITHPRTGERLYHTGDLGRYLPDGNIEFLGREDFQVKIRGHRIELGEIEAMVRQHPGVREVVVVAAGGERSNKQLVAYIVAKQEPPPEVGAVCEFLRTKLPEHMIPAVVLFLPALPMTSTSKIDRKALPNPSLRSAVHQEISSCVLSATAAHISQIVADVLRVETVPPDEQFFAMGIDSLDIIEIAARLNDKFGFRPAMADIFRLTTVAALAEYYEEHQVDGQTPNGMTAADTGSHISPIIASFKLLLDPKEREDFKKREPGLRQLCAEAFEIALPSPALPEEISSGRYARRSHRHFASSPVLLDQFGELLSSLRQHRANSSPRYLYGSAGGLYPVQTYLHIKQNQVQGIGEGTYYYQPQKHQLVLLSRGISFHRGIHSPSNRLIFDEAAFSIFLIGRLSAIAPIYGDESMRFALIEAGLIAQLLETSAPLSRIGLCQIGSLDFDCIRSAFALEESDVFLHSLLGGGIDEPAAPERDEGLL
jgi:pyochelin synthetase